VYPEACVSVEWRYCRGEGGKHLVTASGHLKHGDRPIEVKWESTMHTDKNSHVSVAKPVSASEDREDIKLPSAFPGKIAEAASGT